MTILLKQIFGLLKLLNSDKGTNQIAAGFAVGFILGMSPFLSLQGLLVFILMLFFRIQLGAAFLSAFFFSFIAWVFDPVFHSLGGALLSSESLKSLWTLLYTAPVIPFTRFNNSVILGAGVFAILLSPLIFFGSKILIEKYREKVVEKFKDTKFWKVVKSTALFKWYASYDKLY